jgi:hypothetical protein
LLSSPVWQCLLIRDREQATTCTATGGSHLKKKKLPVWKARLAFQSPASQQYFYLGTNPVISNQPAVLFLSEQTSTGTTCQTNRLRWNRMATWSWSPLKLVASIPLSWDSTLLVCFSCRRYVALQIQMYLFIHLSN